MAKYRVYLGEDVNNYVNIERGVPELILITGETTDVLRFTEGTAVVAEFLNPYGWVEVGDEDSGQDAAGGACAAGCGTRCH